MANNYDYDVVVIGAGPGGLAAAYTLSSSKKVLVIENNLWGGTCPNFGCDPKKMLYSVVESKRQANQYDDNGLRGTSAVSVDWPSMIKFKQGYTDKIPGGTESGLASSNIDHVYGTAEFIDQHTVLVDNNKYQSKQFIIATGAKASIPEIPGTELFDTSTEFLAMPSKPDSIGIVGAGYVAIEIANIAIESGIKVDIFQHNDRILSGFPAEFTGKLAELLEKKGVTFHWNSSVSQLQDAPDGSITLSTNDQQTYTFNHVFAAVGRGANIESLHLDKAGVQSNHGGVIVNQYQQSTANNIFAIGDAVSKSIPKLTPVASYEGRYVADFILERKTDPIIFPAIPHTVFAGPELSQVGVTLNEAKDDPQKYQIKNQSVGSWYSYLRVLDDSAQIATITDGEQGTLVGAVVLSSNAEELINYFTEMINDRKGAKNLPDQIPVYPSAASDLSYLM